MKDLLRRALAILGAIALFPMEVLSMAARVGAHILIEIVIVLVIVLTTRGIYEFAGRILPDIGVPQSFFTSAIERSISQVTVFVCIGIAVFVLRSRLLFLYGLVEVFVGALVAWLLVVKFNSTPPFTDNLTWLSVLSGVYIIVRGLDNMDKANKALPSDTKSLRRRLFDRYILRLRLPPDGDDFVPGRPVRDLWTYARWGVSSYDLQRRKEIEKKNNAAYEKKLRLAMQLDNVADKLSAIPNLSGTSTIVISKTKKAITIYRDLLPIRTETLTPELAKILSKLATRLSMNQEHAEALAVAEEAAELYRKLAKPTEVSAFVPDLALALNELSSKFAALGLQDDARAVAVRQELAFVIRAIGQRDD
jgi:hypothetical protein